MMLRAQDLYEVVDTFPQGKGTTHRFLMTFIHRGRSSRRETATVILMNPSKAHQTLNQEVGLDGTLGKVLIWCHSQGLPLVKIVNLFSIREPKSNRLTDCSMDELNDNRNNQFIINACDDTDMVIVAWGQCKGVNGTVKRRRMLEVLNLLDPFQDKLFHVGTLVPKSKAFPRHGRAWNKNPKLHRLHSADFARMVRLHSQYLNRYCPGR